jgi:hypothetical protein
MADCFKIIGKHPVCTDCYNKDKLYILAVQKNTRQEHNILYKTPKISFKKIIENKEIKKNEKDGNYTLD